MTNCAEFLPPEGEIVFTLIDDEKGIRNEALLKRHGNLFYVPTGEMYVYYRPTHWRPATAEELQTVRNKALAKLRDAESLVDRIDAQIDTREAA